jgi:hypothetical protein
MIVFLSDLLKGIGKIALGLSILLFLATFYFMFLIIQVMWIGGTYRLIQVKESKGFWPIIFRNKKGEDLNIPWMEEAMPPIMEKAMAIFILVCSIYTLFSLILPILFLLKD